MSRILALTLFRFRKGPEQNLSPIAPIPMSSSSTVPRSWSRDLQHLNESPLFPCLGASYLLTISPCSVLLQKSSGDLDMGPSGTFSWIFCLVPCCILTPPLCHLSSWIEGTGCDTISILRRFPDLMWEDWVVQAFSPSDTRSGWPWNKGYCLGIVRSWECRQRMWMVTLNRSVFLRCAAVIHREAV